MKILVMVTGLLMSTGVWGAEPARRVGALVGVSWADFSANTDINYASKARLTTGFLYEQIVSRWFSVQPELRYIDKSAGTESLNMIVIPVFAVGKYPIGELVTPHAMLGPEFGLKLSGPDSTARFEFAVDFGVGADVAVTKTSAVFLDLRYSMGLSDLLDADLLSAQSRAVQIIGGVKIDW